MAKPIKKESPGSSPTVTTPKEDPRKKIKSQTSAPETYVKSEHSQQDQQQRETVLGKKVKNSQRRSFGYLEYFG